VCLGKWTIIELACLGGIILNEPTQLTDFSGHNHLCLGYQPYVDLASGVPNIKKARAKRDKMAD